MAYELERHTDHRSHCWWVRDTESGETYGYGLTEDQAEWLQRQLEQARPEAD